MRGRGGVGNPAPQGGARGDWRTAKRWKPRAWEVGSPVCFLRKEERRCRQRQSGGRERLSPEPPLPSCGNAARSLGAEGGSCPCLFTHWVVSKPRDSHTPHSLIELFRREPPPPPPKKNLFQSLRSCAQGDSGSLLASCGYTGLPRLSLSYAGNSPHSHP